MNDRAATLAAARRGALALALLVSASAVASAAAGDDAPALLRRMSDAMRTQTYEGTLVYTHDGKIESLGIVHAMIGGRERERLRVLTGKPFEVVRDGDTVTCVWPDKHRVVVSHRAEGLLPPKPPRGLQSLPPTYAAKLAGQGRIAGRTARIVRIASRDTYRYGYRLWIDPSSGLMLRSDLVGPDGDVVERLMFTELRRPESVDPARLRPSVADGHAVPSAQPGDDSVAIDDPEWQVTDLPEGFHVVSERRQSMPPDGQSVQHFVFSDGLASVSVFIEPPSARPMPLDGLSRFGAVHAFGRQLDDHHVTVVGEVPAATVRRIAASVQRVDRGS